MDLYQSRRQHAPPCPCRCSVGPLGTCAMVTGVRVRLPLSLYIHICLYMYLYQSRRQHAPPCPRGRRVGPLGTCEWHMLYVRKRAFKHLCVSICIYIYPQVYIYIYRSRRRQHAPPCPCGCRMGPSEPARCGIGLPRIHLYRCVSLVMDMCLYISISIFLSIYIWLSIHTLDTLYAYTCTCQARQSLSG